jgi:glutamine---fructose-6-phosphate transaminase (isomerizing)
VTHFLQDILRQPAELRRSVEYLTGTGRNTLMEAASLVAGAENVCVTGIGASWHAALNAGSVFRRAGRPVWVEDASELLHFTVLPPKSVLIVISRTGRSIEIVRLLDKARQSGATVIAVTNSPDARLAREATLSLVIPANFDHGISVNTYSTLSLAAAALAAAVSDDFDAISSPLQTALQNSEGRLREWQEQIATSAWPQPHVAYYFLARGPSFGSCHAARLLWEEGVKSPATCLSTGNFRHGPQEIVSDRTRFGIWIDAERMREQDLAVARDLCKLGASVMLIGQDLPQDASDLVLRVPPIPAGWQFVVDVIPAQLAAERLAQRSGVDCDSFRICSYVVEDEYGLLGK